MKNINDMMRELKQATDHLRNLHFDQSIPWQSLNQMQHMFDHDFWKNIGTLTQQQDAQTVNKTMEENRTQEDISNSIPRADVFETLGKVIICCEVPGLVRNSLKLTVENGDQLLIQGVLKKHDLLEYRIQTERYEGNFFRQLGLPSKVSPRNVRTEYRDGLLEIFLTKKQTHKQKNKRNEIKVDFI